MLEKECKRLKLSHAELLIALANLSEAASKIEGTTDFKSILSFAYNHGIVGQEQIAVWGNVQKPAACQWINGKKKAPALSKCVVLEKLAVHCRKLATKQLDLGVR